MLLRGTLFFSIGKFVIFLSVEVSATAMVELCALVVFAFSLVALHLKRLAACSEVISKFSAVIFQFAS